MKVDTLLQTRDRLEFPSTADLFDETFFKELFAMGLWHSFPAIQKQNKIPTHTLSVLVLTQDYIQTQSNHILKFKDCPTHGWAAMGLS